ncbi:MAG: hypothetical protein EAX95_14230 [Candidatus Thorarchaeota archaeon]|nr:hypothetical protein [Candidatus Thorarchaeota archaeon]
MCKDDLPDFLACMADSGISLKPLVQKPPNPNITGIVIYPNTSYYLARATLCHHQHARLMGL